MELISYECSLHICLLNHWELVLGTFLSFWLYESPIFYWKGTIIYYMNTYVYIYIYLFVLFFDIGGLGEVVRLVRPP